MRYFIDMAYRGTRYHGWQRQHNAHTVQGELNEALRTVLQQEVSTMGSGRTDAGVHAIQQIVHFDSNEPIDAASFRRRMNRLLPADMAVNAIRRVKEGISARFDAVSRAYVYKIHQQKSPFKASGSYYFTRVLDVDAMNACCEWMGSWENFEALSRVKTEVRDFNCKVFEAYWRHDASAHDFHFHIRANRFLRGMVRALVGTLLLVGAGKVTLADFQAILASRDRKKAGRAVPAHGLYLRDLAYSEDIYL